MYGLYFRVYGLMVRVYGLMFRAPAFFDYANAQTVTSYQLNAHCMCDCT